MTSCIYKITNLINNKVYIGKSCDYKRRWKQHESNYRNKKDTYLYRAMNKYGFDNFYFEIIHSDIPNDKIDELEITYIKEYNCKAPNGYNMTDGGEGSIGRKMSKKTLDKLKEARANYILSDETRKKMSDVQKERFSNPEERKRMSEILKGHKKKSKENYKKVWDNKDKSEKQKQLNALVETRKVPILMLNIETLEVIKEFTSTREASRWIQENTKYPKAGHQNIGKACRGQVNYVYGYKWSYK